MLCYVYDRTGTELLRTESREPVCDEDLCDRCGECLACGESVACMAPYTAHVWIVEED